MSEYIDREKAIEAFTFADADVCQEYGDYDCEFGFSRENIRGILESTPVENINSRIAKWTTSAVTEKESEVKSEVVNSNLNYTLHFYLTF